MTTIAKIYQLLYTRELEHVELAVYLAKAADINLLEPYKKLAEFLEQTDVQLYPFEAQREEIKLLHALLFVHDITFGQELYHTQATYYYNDFKAKKKFIVRSLPEELIYLHFLRDLRVFSPKLQALPENIDRLRFLKSIQINTGQIKYLPNALFQLSSLEVLKISWNQLQLVPKELAKLSSLRVLNFAYNEIHEVSDELFQLENLENLSLEGNQLVVVPSFIYQLKNLVKLNLAENHIPKKEMEKAYAFVHQNAERIASEQFYEIYSDYFTAISIENQKGDATIEYLNRSFTNEDVQRALPSAETPTLTAEDIISYKVRFS